jgi:hypothetical protein
VVVNGLGASALRRRPPVLEVGARQGAQGVHDGAARLAQGKNELLKRIAKFFLEDDEVREDAAEMGYQRATA